ncbi:MAG: NAD(P)/FAD-dependent oxidoreductase [Acidobacteriota bacterium]
MNNPQSTIRDPQSKIVIAGAGPAGASLAIRLTTLGIETVLIERERFPRHKLCGEFISPECLKHFESLGVLENMLSAGGDRILETRFFESGGKSVAVPTRWFGEGDFALSLSRAEMDNRLLDRAKEIGVTVHEATAVTDIESEDGRVVAVRTRTANGDIRDIHADLFVDATGRSRILTKLVEKKQDVAQPLVKPELVGFKAHLRDVDLARGLCEIYSFQGGYAGLSHVEDGLFNLCFLIKAATVRSIGSDAAELVKQVVTRNKRAAVTLREATAIGDWLAVSIDSFGTKNTSAATNLFTVGDAAAFIDPFTGSGMVMAFESAEVLANAITAGSQSSVQIAREYQAAYREKFANRLRVCSMLRRTAFMPNVATAIVTLLGISTTARRRLAQATR